MQPFVVRPSINILGKSPVIILMGFENGDQRVAKASKTQVTLSSV